MTETELPIDAFVNCPPTVIVNKLAKFLRDGCLCLFIGSGVSMSTNNDEKDISNTKFPGWISLVDRLCKIHRRPFDLELAKKSNDYILSTTEAIEAEYDSPESGFLEIVKKNLYKGITYDINTLKLRLMIAIGSLVMGMIGGSAGVVVNYNFDDVFEWYLANHGFRIQVISDFFKLTKRCDVTIYHPHGFLPYTKKFFDLQTKDIVFSKISYERILGDDNHPWNQLVKNLLATKVCLFVGLSGQDLNIRSLCTKTYEVIGKKRALGFVVLQKKLGQNKQELLDTNAEFTRRGLVPFYVNEHNETPDLLLKISRSAAEI
ncbi:MAG: hypothetical protein C4570_03820 [Ammonifex sp.]|jgi:hypothetical protein|nr:MAG: hypothetical protein C4570_03820 [Ammonifex sp.]